MQAPEILDGSRYNASVDVYSYAVTVFECACHANYAKNEFRGESRYAVCTGWRPQPPTALTKKYPLVWDLIQHCWRPENTEVKGALVSLLSAHVAKRPTFMDIVERLEAMSSPHNDTLGSRVGSNRTISPASQILGEFTDVTLAEVRQVEGLSRDLSSLHAASDHVGGCVALLRLIREELMENAPVTAVRVQNMLKLRAELGSNAKAAEILERKLTLHTLPGAAERRAASFDTNECIGTTKQGDLVTVEQWGTILPMKFVIEFPVEDNKILATYLSEAQAMMFDLLSRRAKRLVGFARVLDTHGMSFAHRKLLPYMKEAINGDATKTVPRVRFLTPTFLVRTSGIVAGIFNIGKRTFLSERQKGTLTLLSGPDPFIASSAFAMFYERSALPFSIGGTLDQTAEAGLPAIINDESVWTFYEERLPPGLRAEAQRTASMLTPDSSWCILATTPSLSMFPPEELEAARARHRDSPNSFSCFLSHHKQACAAEARLVKLQLETFLDAKVFLGESLPPSKTI